MFYGAIRNRSARLVSLWSVAWLLSTMSGCACCHWFEPPGPPPVKEVMMWWDDNLHLTQDPARYGASLPGLAGRTYLFSGENQQLAEASGKIVVGMYDMTPTHSGGEAAQLVAVTYDMNALKQLKRKDQIGDGYTLFIPWETYHPAVKEVMVKLAYLPDKGTPFYPDPVFINLKTTTSTPFVQGHTQQIIPGMQTADRK
jgi:hypothetical protein